nr:AraC family transcriptional regulator [Paracraurococcus ruber]
MRLDLGAGRWETAFRPGDLALKPPDATTFAAADTPHRKSFLSLPAGLVAGILAGGGLPGLAGTAPDFRRLHAGPFRCGQLTALLDALWREPSLGTPQGRLFGDGILLAVVATLARHARPDLAPAPRGPALSRGRIDRVRAYVDAHLAEAFGIGDLAAVVGLSPWHFSRAFKAATGRTPRAFVTARRVERAKALLADGDLPLSEVAQACGFADQAHFSTIFRRHAGLPPGAWRRAL